MGVNQHMTPTFTNVKGIKQYSVINSVMVGNGLGFSILAIGTFQVPRTLLNIKNVLIVPTLKKDYSLFLNLLLITIVTLCFIHRAF
jgi:hypothetical protein